MRSVAKMFGVLQQQGYSVVMPAEDGLEVR
jgi:hypothetical protein